MPTSVTRQQYFDSAYKLLSSEGFTSLQVVRLCSVLGVTTGSFYNYFRNLNDFIAQFLQTWRQDETKRIIEVAEVIDEPAERFRKLSEQAMTVPHEAEAELRAWSRVNEMVHAVQHEVDELRLGLIRRAVLNLLPCDPQANHLAALGLSIVVGMQQLQSPIDHAQLKWALDQYVHLVLARASGSSEAITVAPDRRDLHQTQV
ncbi:transcriptional regulator, TetR family [Haloechinothrix alba]|uniref:Transcriptional regulator, TetR family n=1 Tax=Haloechinothrix alba TaxID=664784 RepID=A0A238XPT9_9PSEU|nr:transcriptional regulator, TetR family [Haloechinothrix alba]